MPPSELLTEPQPSEPQSIKAPPEPSSSSETMSTTGYRYPSSAAERRPVQHEEYQYLNLIKHILADGEFRPDRTGTGTLSLFAPPQLRFSLRDNSFPLLTTKRVFFRAVVEELLWFVRADTNALHLSERGVKIWDGNGSREYLDSIGLHERKVGDLGPVYGFQWRHFGAEYVDCETDYTGQGVDQLAEVVYKLKNNPYDRRIIMSAWNPAGTPYQKFSNGH
jgi:thymidylate synthase